MKEQDDELKELDSAKDEKSVKKESDDTSDYEDICYICRRPESKAGKMIRLPVNNICI